MIEEMSEFDRRMVHEKYRSVVEMLERRSEERGEWGYEVHRSGHLAVEGARRTGSREEEHG